MPALFRKLRTLRFTNWDPGALTLDSMPASLQVFVLLTVNDYGWAQVCINGSSDGDIYGKE